MKDIKNIGQVEKILKENKLEIKDRRYFYRFWSKVDIKDNSEECWNWMGSILQNGYGSSSSTNTTEFYAHRVAYMLIKGPISEGLEVQHLCNNRMCCNPNHLELGNRSKNVQYMTKCGRGNHPKGESHPFSKLTEDRVREIHKIHRKRPYLRQWQIAEMFNVHPGTISLIINGKIWCHIYDEIYKKY